MGFIETSIATAEQVRLAHKVGVKLSATCMADIVDPEGWRLQILFEKEGKRWSYEGRMFRATNLGAAETRAEHQLRKLLGQSSRIAEKLSAEFRAAREALEQRIELAWAACGGSGTDLLKPGPIKVNWTRREPRLKVHRFTGVDALRKRYDPEFSRFEQAVRSELVP